MNLGHLLLKLWPSLNFCHQAHEILVTGSGQLPKLFLIIFDPLFKVSRLLKYISGGIRDHGLTYHWQHEPSFKGRVNRSFHINRSQLSL